MTTPPADAYIIGSSQFGNCDVWKYPDGTFVYLPRQAGKSLVWNSRGAEDSATERVR